MRPTPLILMVILAVCALFSADEVQAAAAVGENAPAFILTTRDGKKFDLLEQKGKVVIISYWATWCPPCREELPVLEALWRTYHSQGLEIVAVSVDNGSMLTHVKQAVKVFTMPIAMESAVTKNDLSPFDSVPKLFVIGKDGKVKSVRDGAAQEPLIEKAFNEEIKALLDGKPEAKADAPKGEETEPKPEEKK